MKRGKLKPRAGQWWGLIDERLSLWCRLCQTDSAELKDVAGMYRMARWYFGFGILGKIARCGYLGDLDGTGHVVDLETGEVLP